MRKLLALDLSLTGLGMIVMPANWGGDWTKLSRRTFEHKLPKDATQGEKTNRLVQLASEVVHFAKTNHAAYAVHEQYAFNQPGGRTFDLGELGGVVKHELFRNLGIITEPVNVMTARKFLLGRLPKKTELLPGGRKKDSGAKAWAQEGARRAGCPEVWTEDERDAWVVANLRAGELGWYAVTGLLTEPK